LSVTDQGVGISSEDQQRLFQPLFRSDMVKMLPGSGLGLSLVQHIAQQHNGVISVKSQLGQGTTITVRFIEGANPFLARLASSIVAD
jgi:signal transduction histidine kinase